ncbi:MAG: cyclase family protein [Bacillota bacterium]|nr:cyclase family protein [Bacillota bacterium]
MKIIDLGKELYQGMEVFPGDPDFEIGEIHTIDSHGWNLSTIKIGLHTGSHLDAPYHMDPKGKTIDQIPLTNTVCQALKTKNLDKVKENLGLIIDFPLDQDQVEKLLKLRPSFVGGDLDQEVERRLLQAGIITYTDLENIDLLPYDQIFLFVGQPLKIRNGDGSPVRPLAIFL